MVESTTFYTVLAFYQSKMTVVVILHQQKLNFKYIEFKTMDLYIMGHLPIALDM